VFGESAGDAALFKVRMRLDMSDAFGEGGSCPSETFVRDADDNGGEDASEKRFFSEAL